MRAALVLWPEKRFNAICASAGTEAAIARLSMLIEDLLAETDPSNKTELERSICKLVDIICQQWKPYSPNKSNLQNFLDCLFRWGNAHALEKITEHPLLEHYSGRENKILAQAVEIMPPASVDRIFKELIKLHGEYQVAACMDLWIGISRSYAKSNRPVVFSLFQALLETMKNAERGRADNHRHYGSEDGDINLDSTLIVRFLEASTAYYEGSSLNAVQPLISNKQYFSSEDLLLPTVFSFNHINSLFRRYYKKACNFEIYSF